MAAVLISGPVSTRQEARTRARAREFSSDSLSAGARLAGRSHGLTPGWFCWPHRLSECTSRITRREGFTPFDRVDFVPLGLGSVIAAVQLDRFPAMSLLRLSCIHCDYSGLFYLFTDSLCRSMR